MQILPPQAIEHPPVPTAGQVARLTDDQLKMMISVALDSYSKELDGFTTGDGWKKYFQLAELKERIAASQDWLSGYGYPGVYRPIYRNYSRQPPKIRIMK